jgi:hypothetical protein
VSREKQRTRRPGWMMAFVAKIPLVSLAVEKVRRIARGVPAIPATSHSTREWFTSCGTAAMRYGGCHYRRFLVPTTLDCWIDEWPATTGEVQYMGGQDSCPAHGARRPIRARAQRLAVPPVLMCGRGRPVRAWLRMGLACPLACRLSGEGEAGALRVSILQLDVG